MHAARTRQPAQVVPQEVCQHQVFGGLLGVLQQVGLQVGVLGRSLPPRPRARDGPGRDRLALPAHQPFGAARHDHLGSAVCVRQFGVDHVRAGIVQPQPQIGRQGLTAGAGRHAARQVDLIHLARQDAVLHGPHARQIIEVVRREGADLKLRRFWTRARQQPCPVQMGRAHHGERSGLTVPDQPRRIPAPVLGVVVLRLALRRMGGQPPLPRRLVLQTTDPGRKQGRSGGPLRQRALYLYGSGAEQRQARLRGDLPERFEQHQPRQTVGMQPEQRLVGGEVGEGRSRMRNGRALSHGGDRTACPGCVS